jgi:hypothetical protein
VSGSSGGGVGGGAFGQRGGLLRRARRQQAVQQAGHGTQVVEGDAGGEITVQQRGDLLRRAQLGLVHRTDPYLEDNCRALIDQGRTLNQAGLQTEAEVFHITVSTVVYYRLPGDSTVISRLNQAAKYLIYEKKDVDVQVAEYGYINFATARSATATIDRGSRTITVELPTPAVRTYIYSVGKVSISEGPLNAIGTMVKALFAAIMHKPVVSTDISSELQAARSAIGGRVNPVEIFGCGKNEMEQQLAGIFASLPQYRGWAVVAQYSGMRSVPESQCQALHNRLVHTS